ncbi:MAG TPA: MipA/OmpV family protein [Steroidobacteraceae bacterium]|jgi:outer membrane scaffolding protein for murein synthesis (MipA/OmpV family)
MPRLRSTLSALAALAALAAGTTHAEEKPLWEVGLGAGFLVFNDYRGAATTHVYPVPVPYLIYRGKFLKSDRDGLRGLFLNQDRVELSLSVNATAPVRNDSARHGMPDLRSTVEVGPQLNVHLWRSADQRVKLDLRLPLRTALTLQAAPHYVGVFIEPHLALDLAQFQGDDGWKLGLLAGPLFADRRYDDYFYTVAPQFAAADRPTYTAHGGYAGSEALASLTRRYPRFWVGAYLRHDSLAGASFENSPLVRRDSYWSAGFGVAWLIRQSDRLVESDD